jgi:hypothetical protein
MSHVKNETIQKMQAQREKLNARIQLLKNKQASDARKQDARRKILAGAYLIEVLHHGDVRAVGEMLAQAGFLEERDRVLFGLDAQNPAVQIPGAENPSDRFAGV